LSAASADARPRALVTGCAGFAARHLVPLLGEDGHAVHGIDRVSPGTAIGEQLAGFHEGDITDFAFLERAAAEVRPEVVVHLAAVTYGRPAGPEDRRFFEVNVDGTRLLIEAMLAAELAPRMLVTSSSAVYGGAPRDEQPLVEDTPLRPQTLYAASKASQELVALTYHRTHDLPVIVTRAFNHTGAGENPHFACSSFSRQIAEIEAGRREPPLRVGNLSAFRDFLDARDVARGYRAAVLKGEPGQCYNVCSGAARRMADVLDGLIKLSDRDIGVELDPERLQPSDVPYQCGSNHKLAVATGWQPLIPFERALADLLDHWRGQVGNH
jgi:GDP-4-dehydro-6-deoxy-D-mannose reductase